MREKREARLVDEQQRFRLMNRRNSSGQLAGVPALALMASRSICFQSVNCTPADSSSIDPRREITPCTHRGHTRRDFFLLSWYVLFSFPLPFPCDLWSITRCLPLHPPPLPLPLCWIPLSRILFFFNLSLLPSNTFFGRKSKVNWKKFTLIPLKRNLFLRNFGFGG